MNVLRRKFEAVVMNQSVRGKKVKKEKKIIAAVLEDYTSSIALLLSGKLKSSALLDMTYILYMYIFVHIHTPVRYIFRQKILWTMTSLCPCNASITLTSILDASMRNTCNITVVCVFACSLIHDTAVFFCGSLFVMDAYL